MSYEKRNLYTSWVLSNLDVAKKDSETCFRGTFCDLGHRKRNATQRTEKAKKEDAAPARGAGGWTLPTLRFCLSFRWFRNLSCDSVVFGGLEWRHGLKSLQTLQMPNKVMPNIRCDDNDDDSFLGRLMMSELYIIYHVLGFWLSGILLLGWKITDYHHIFYHQRLKIVFFKTNHHYFLIPYSHAATIFSSLILMQPLWRVRFFYLVCPMRSGGTWRWAESTWRGGATEYLRFVCLFVV